MKKILSFVAVAAFMLFAGKANAQLSVHAGYQNYTIKAHTEVLGVSADNSDSEDGFYIGASYDYTVGGGLGVAPGLYFAYVEDVMDIRVPILLNYGINMDEIGISVFAGPQINFGVSGDMYSDDGNYNRFDLGISFGLQLSYKNISLEGGYTMGILNRWKDAPTDCYMKANQLFVGLGYTL